MSAYPNDYDWSNTLLVDPDSGQPNYVALDSNDKQFGFYPYKVRPKRGKMNGALRYIAQWIQWLRDNFTQELTLDVEITAGTDGWEPVGGGTPEQFLTTLRYIRLKDRLFFRFEEQITKRLVNNEQWVVTLQSGAWPQLFQDNEDRTANLPVISNRPGGVYGYTTQAFVFNQSSTLNNLLIWWGGPDTSGNGRFPVDTVAQESGVLPIYTNF